MGRWEYVLIFKAVHMCQVYSSPYAYEPAMNKQTSTIFPPHHMQSMLPANSRAPDPPWSLQACHALGQRWCLAAGSPHYWGLIVRLVLRLPSVMGGRASGRPGDDGSPVGRSDSPPAPHCWSTRAMMPPPQTSARSKVTPEPSVAAVDVSRLRDIAIDWHAMDVEAWYHGPLI